MEDTTKRLARLLGASGIESMGHDVRFVVEAADGTRLRMNIEGQQQRLMAVLTDTRGVTRADLDVAPVQKVTEDPGVPGRVTVHVGAQLIHIDSKPTLAFAVTSKS